MMFFVMIFATGFNLTNSIENDNESNISIEKLLDSEQFDENMDMDLACLDNLQSINQTVMLDDEIYLDMNSIISEEKEVIHGKNENNSENRNIDSLSQNRYNNEYSENHEYDDEESRRDIEEALRHPYVLDAMNRYEQSLSSHNFNFYRGEDSLINSNGKVFQEYPSNYNATSIHDNILSENYPITSCNLPFTSSEINSKGKNELIKNTYATLSKTLDDQEKSIFISNMQSCHDIDYKDSALNSEETLDNMQLVEIPDLTLYKDSLKSLSMKNNRISSITEIIEKLTYLEKLDLSHNRINKIECKMENMKLEWLDLSYNSLKYSSCGSIFSMTTLKYLNLQHNRMISITKFNSKSLLSLNISNNPVQWIEESFYELPNIVKLFMSNLKVTKSIYFNKTLPNLKVLDLSYNKSTLSVYNIVMLTALEEINLSTCELKSFPISSSLLNLKKIILFNNNIKFFSIGLKKLRANIKILDLRDNPLKIILVKPYMGALGLLVHFYGKVILNESIMQDIQRLSLDQIYSQKYKKEAIHFQKEQKNTIDDEFYINIGSLIVEGDSNELKKNKVEKIITLVEEIRDSGFMEFEKIMKKTMKILECENSKSIIIDRILIHLNTKFSSKFYRFLDGVLFNYKIQILKSALNYIYNSDEHLNYWMYHLRNILSFTVIEKIEENSKIHNDRNIILSSFINIADPGKLIRSIKLELEGDKEMVKIFLNLLHNMKEKIKKTYTNGILKQSTIAQYDDIKYILKKYRIIDQYQ